MEYLTDVLNKLKNIIYQILVVLLYFFIVIGFALLFYKDVSSSNIVIYTLSNILGDLILLIVFLFIFRKIIVPDFYDFKKNWRSYLKDGLLYYLIGLIIMNVSVTIIESFIGLPVNEEANRTALGLYPIYSIISMLIIAPIVEELMTRVVLKDTFKHPIIYIILSGLIFGSLHVLTVLTTGDLKELLFIIPYGTLGSFLCYMYYKTKNIWTNISFHFFHNLICLIVFFWSI